MSDLEDAKTVAAASGNRLHSSVVNAFQQAGWSTLVSPYYLDSATNKPRELDLIAEKAWPVYDRSSRHAGYFIVRLFVECKYVPQPTVIWFSNRDNARATEWVVQNTPLKADNVFINEHHYLKPPLRVAKLFASKTLPNTENEALFRALNQTLNGLIALQHREGVLQGISNRGPILATIAMPLIVCNDFSKLFSVEMEDPQDPKPIDAGFLLEVNYASANPQGSARNDYFLIDIVAFDQLAAFFDVVESDKETVFRVPLY